MRKAALALLLCFIPAASLAAAPKNAPPPSKEQRLQTLFKELQQVQEEEDAKPIETEINAIFTQSGSPTVDLLMLRAQAALTANKLPVARKLIESITHLAPNFAEGWHRLAALQSAAKDDRGAMLSLQKTIELNPRHFTAYAELGGFLEDY